MNGVYVFLGPSVRIEDARDVLEAEYLPPVKMGDVQALVRARPRVIAIVDGYFERVPAVWQLVSDWCAHPAHSCWSAR